MEILIIAIVKSIGMLFYAIYRGIDALFGSDKPSAPKTKQNKQIEITQVKKEPVKQVAVKKEIVKKDNAFLSAIKNKYNVVKNWILTTWGIIILSFYMIVFIAICIATGGLALLVLIPLAMNAFKQNSEGDKENNAGLGEQNSSAGNIKSFNNDNSNLTTNKQIKSVKSPAMQNNENKNYTNSDLEDDEYLENKSEFEGDAMRDYFDNDFDYEEWCDDHSDPH